jgi:hypothetical protein
LRSGHVAFAADILFGTVITGPGRCRLRAAQIFLNAISPEILGAKSPESAADPTNTQASDFKGEPMPCPVCGCSVGEFRSTDSVETHGLDCGPYEYFHEEYVICRGCDERFDLAEWSAAEPDMDVT